jgi:hypothetical protein
MARASAYLIATNGQRDSLQDQPVSLDSLCSNLETFVRVSMAPEAGKSKSIASD